MDCWIKSPSSRSNDGSDSTVTGDEALLNPLSTAHDQNIFGQSTSVAETPIEGAAVGLCLGQRTQQASSQSSSDTSLELPRYFVPLCLCLSDRLHQAEIIKAETIETDSVVFQRLQQKYCQALNPMDRYFAIVWTPRLSWIRKLSLNSFTRWSVNCQWWIWNWVYPLYSAVWLWDLKEVKKVRV